jgi:hypothetical protein
VISYVPMAAVLCTLVRPVAQARVEILISLDYNAAENVPRHPFSSTRPRRDHMTHFLRAQIVSHKKQPIHPNAGEWANVRPTQAGSWPFPSLLRSSIGKDASLAPNP